MPFERLPDSEQPCAHPEHTPPMHICLPAGNYRYRCPGCGRSSKISSGVAWR